MRNTVNLTYIALPVHSAILARAAWTGLWRTYPFFYAQLSCSLAASAVLLYVWLWFPAAYFIWYWDMQILTMLTACASLLELSRQGFDVGGLRARRFGRAIYYMTYVLAGGAGLVYWLRFRVVSKTAAMQSALVAFERDFRMIQAFILLALLAGLFYFAVPLGENLQGIFLGYGIYIGSSLVTLALEFRFLRSFDHIWSLIQPAAYVVSLLTYLYLPLDVSACGCARPA